MMIILYGRGLQERSWHVNETRPPQHVRIYYMDGGTVEYRDSVERFSLQKGWLYVFPAQQCYELIQDPDDPISCMYLHADVFPYIVQRPIKIDPTSHPEILATLHLLQTQIAHRREGSSCFVAFGMALLQLLIRDGCFSQRINCSLLDTDSLSTATTVKAMSRQAGYSSEHFIRSFSSATGITPYQYILGQRMNEAISLMSQGLTMEDIASRVGYASAKSFSGAFKRHYGISPQYYRMHFLRRA